MSMRGRVAGPLLLLAATVGLAGCDSVGEALGFEDDNTLEIGPTCPRVAVGDDVGYIARFDGNGNKRANLRYAVKIDQPNGICYLNEDSIDVEMSVPISVQRGAAAGERDVSFEYFIAVARIDKTILERQSYQVTESMRVDEVEQIFEEFDYTIPTEPGEPGSNFVIIVGLVLTEGELEEARRPRIYNRGLNQGQVKTP
jgi:hypothetical protein